MRWWHFVIAVLIALGASMFFIDRNMKRHTRDTYAQNVKNAPYDVIIIPGIPYDTAHVNSMFNTRILWAKNLYDQGIARNIIFSGGAVHSPYVEAVAMMLVADSLGIPVNHIYCEVNAQHSKDNVYYGWLMAHKLGFTKIAVATDPFQSFYLEKFVTANMPDIAMLPLNVDSLKRYNQKLPVINAISALVKDFVPVESKQGFFKRMNDATSTDLPKALPDSVMQAWSRK